MARGDYGAKAPPLVARPSESVFLGQQLRGLCLETEVKEENKKDSFKERKQKRNQERNEHCFALELSFFLSWVSKTRPITRLSGW